MFCGKCGSVLPEGARFCSVCGTPASVPNETPQQAYAQPVYEQPVQQMYEQPMQQPYAQQPEVAMQGQMANVVDEDDIPTMPLYPEQPMTIPSYEEGPAMADAPVQETVAEPEAEAVGETPVVEETSVAETVAEAEPVVEQVVEETPVVEEVVEEAPVVEQVIEEASVIEPVIEEAPVVETVSEEIPVAEQEIPMPTEVQYEPVVDEPYVPQPEETHYDAQGAMFAAGALAGAAVGSAMGADTQTYVSVDAPQNAYQQAPQMMGYQTYDQNATFQQGAAQYQEANYQNAQYQQGGYYQEQKNSYYQEPQGGYYQNQNAFVQNTPYQQPVYAQPEAAEPAPMVEATWKAAGSPTVLLSAIFGLLFIGASVFYFIQTMNMINELSGFMYGGTNPMAVILPIAGGIGLIPMLLIVIGQFVIFGGAKAKKLGTGGYTCIKAANIIVIVCLGIVALLYTIILVMMIIGLATASEMGTELVMGFSGIFGSSNMNLYGGYQDFMATAWTVVAIFAGVLITVFTLAFMWYGKMLSSLGIATRALRGEMQRKKNVSMFVIVMKWIGIVFETLMIVLFILILCGVEGLSNSMNASIVMGDLRIYMSPMVQGAEVMFYVAFAMVVCKYLWGLFYNIALIGARGKVKEAKVRMKQ